jgi:hypothetical protein
VIEVPAALALERPTSPDREVQAFAARAFPEAFRLSVIIDIDWCHAFSARAQIENADECEMVTLSRCDKVLQPLSARE